MIRVLIVEDQAILRESLARSVGDQPDMTVVAAIADASEALGVALKERPDMILIQTASWRRHASRSSCPSVASLS
jgi:DNA-binding NarL/FixJ family response regulator